VTVLEQRVERTRAELAESTRTGLHAPTQKDLKKEAGDVTKLEKKRDGLQKKIGAMEALAKELTAAESHRDRVTAEIKQIGERMKPL